MFALTVAHKLEYKDISVRAVVHSSMKFSGQSRCFFFHVEIPSYIPLLAKLMTLKMLLLLLHVAKISEHALD